MQWEADSLEETLAASGYRKLIGFLGAELTLYTTRGTFSVFSPRSCLRVEAGRLVLAHPCSVGISFERSEVLGVRGGVGVLLYTGKELSAAQWLANEFCKGYFQKLSDISVLKV